MIRKTIHLERLGANKSVCLQITLEGFYTRGNDAFLHIVPMNPDKFHTMTLRVERYTSDCQDLRRAERRDWFEFLDKIADRLTSDLAESVLCNEGGVIHA